MSKKKKEKIAPKSALGFTEEFQAQRQDTLFYNLLAFVLAVSETLAVYLTLSLSHNMPPLASFLGQVSDANLPWFSSVMLSRGLLQPLNFCLFCFGLNLLILRLWIMRREFSAFDHPYFVGIHTNEEKELVIGEESRLIPLKNVRKISEDYTGTLPLLVRRIEAGSRRLTEDGDANQVHAVMQSVANIDRETIVSRYTPVRYLIWLIPTIGFLGTVIGIGQAITGFTGFMSQIGQGGGDFQAQLQPLLGGVAGKLGVAFDTTVLALLLSAIIVALTSIVQTREEGLLSSIDEFCLRYFVSRIAVPDFGTKQMSEMLQQAFMSVAHAMFSQRTSETEKEDGFSLRDIAGLISAQTEQIKEALSRPVKGTHDSDSLITINKTVESIAFSVENIYKAIDARQPKPSSESPKNK